MDVDSANTALTVLSLVAYFAAVVPLWRFATQQSDRPRLRLALRITAALLLFALIFLWSEGAISRS